MRRRLNAVYEYLALRFGPGMRAFLTNQYFRSNPLGSRSFPGEENGGYPAEIINHCVWLYFRFSLSYRDVEEIMAGATSAVRYNLREMNNAPD